MYQHPLVTLYSFCYLAILTVLLKPGWGNGMVIYLRLNQYLVTTLDTTEMTSSYHCSHWKLMLTCTRSHQNLVSSTIACRGTLPVLLLCHLIVTLHLQRNATREATIPLYLLSQTTAPLEILFALETQPQWLSFHGVEGWIICFPTAMTGWYGKPGVRQGRTSPGAGVIAAPCLSVTVNDINDRHYNI